SVECQPAPCEWRVSRMAAMGSADMGSTEDTLSQNPGENGPGDEIACGIHETYDELSPAVVHGGGQRLPPQRIRDQQSHQGEDEPPPAGAERVKPERSEQRGQERLEQTPCDGPSVVLPDEVPASAHMVNSI